MNLAVVTYFSFPFSYVESHVWRPWFSQKKNCQKTLKNTQSRKKIGNYWEKPVVWNTYEDIESNMYIKNKPILTGTWFFEKSLNLAERI